MNLVKSNQETVIMSHYHVVELVEYLNDLSMFIHCYRCNSQEKYIEKISLSSIYLSRILREYTPYLDSLERALVDFVEMFNKVECSKLTDFMEILDNVISDSIKVFEYYELSEFNHENRHTIYEPTVEAINQVIDIVTGRDPLSVSEEIDFF